MAATYAFAPAQMFSTDLVVRHSARARASRQAGADLVEAAVLLTGLAARSETVRLEAERLRAAADEMYVDAAVEDELAIEAAVRAGIDGPDEMDAYLVARMTRVA